MKAQNVNLNKKENHNLATNFTAMAWLMHEARLIVGTDSGEVYIFDANIDFKGFVSCEFENWPIHSIVPYSKGFLVGGQNATMVIFEKNPEDPKGLFTRHLREIHISEHPDSIVTSMSFNVGPEDTMAAALNNGQIMTTQFSADRAGEDLQFTYLSDKFHTGEITGLDVCVRKPLVATCGTDRTVRIWNYIERTLEVEQ